MTLPLSINVADPGHIGDHEEIHQFLASVAGSFEVASADGETYANRPAAGQVGRIYHATDTGEVFFDTGSQWLTLRAPSGAEAHVSTSETTSSTAYTNLATTGPTITVTVGDTGLLLVGISATLGCSTLNGTHAQPRMAFEGSGSNAISAADGRSIGNDATDTTAVAHLGAVYMLSGLARGSLTLQAKYRGSDPSDVLTFRERRIWARPLA